MFDRFTERARKTMANSREEALRYDHDYIGPEHFLLGLLPVHRSVGVAALRELEVDLHDLRQDVEFRMNQGRVLVTMGQLPFTPAAKKVLELALEEAREFGHNYIGSEHLLLGLIREGNSIAADALVECGVELVPVRETIVGLLEPVAPEPAPPVNSNRSASMKDNVERLLERVRELEGRVRRLQNRE